MKDKKIDPHETMHEVPYKLCPDNTTIHSKFIRDGVYNVEGVIIEAEDHYTAAKIYEEMKK